jgi:hypothetical protein
MLPWTDGMLRGVCGAPKTQVTWCGRTMSCWRMFLVDIREAETLLRTSRQQAITIVRALALLKSHCR